MTCKLTLLVRKLKELELQRAWRRKSLGAAQASSRWKLSTKWKFNAKVFRKRAVLSGAYLGNLVNFSVYKNLAPDPFHRCSYSQNTSKGANTGQMSVLSNGTCNFPHIKLSYDVDVFAIILLICPKYFLYSLFRIPAERPVQSPSTSVRLFVTKTSKNQKNFQKFSQKLV